MTSEDRTGEAQARKGRADDEPGSEDRADGNQSDGGQAGEGPVGEGPVGEGAVGEGAVGRGQAGENQIGRGQAGRGQADGDQDGPRPRDDRLHLDLTDPKAMRALAHPLRWALLEALGHAGTLTATQASEMLGESPANCAFHLRNQGRANDKLTAENGADEDQAAGGRASEREVGPHPPQDEPHPFDDLPQLDLNDPKAMRALAHPLRWALLESLGHAGTLTATQASEMLGESPANCAFHLRTLARYGFVEEAGGGKGRERPWRQAYRRLSWQARQGDEQFRLAGQALNQIWLDRVLSRARRSLAATASWPEGFADDLGGSTSMLYVTPDEARELYGELMKTVERTIGQEHRFTERKDPARRPPGAVPVEFVLLGYPVLDAPPLPGDDGDSDSDDSDTGDPGAGPGG